MHIFQRLYAINSIKCYIPRSRDPSVSDAREVNKSISLPLRHVVNSASRMSQWQSFD